MSLAPPALDPNTLPYTPYYCEENVYYLCSALSSVFADSISTGETHVYAVFLLNPQDKVLMFNQKNNKQTGGRIVWDYHVIALSVHRHLDNHHAHDKDWLSTLCACATTTAYVYDLDSFLSFPCLLSAYYDASFRPDVFPVESAARYVRVCPCPQFLRELSTDRSHMIDTKTGQYMAPPPSTPPIQSPTCKMNLDAYIHIESKCREQITSAVLKLEEFMHIMQTDDHRQGTHRH